LRIYQRRLYGGGSKIGVMSVDIREWLQEAMKHAGFEQADLGRALTKKLKRVFDKATLHRMYAGTRELKVDEFIAIAELTRYPVPLHSTIMHHGTGDAPDGTVLVEPDVYGARGRRARAAPAKEGENTTKPSGKTNLRNGVARMTFPVSNRYIFPPSHLRELGIVGENPMVIRVKGDAGYDPANPYARGSFHEGDRVIVDCDDMVPSPPGPFACYDGRGFIVRRVEYVDGDRVRLSCFNPAYAAIEKSLEEAGIVGRVCGKITTLV
jgi:hypothetical protein